MKGLARLKHNITGAFLVLLALSPFLAVLAVLALMFWLSMGG